MSADVIISELGASEFEEAFGVVSEACVYEQMSLARPIARDKFLEKFVGSKKNFRLFRVLEQSSKAHLCYVGIDYNEGTPYLVFAWENVSFDDIREDLVSRLMEPLLDIYFADPAQPSIFFFAPVEYRDILADPLELMGFDLVDDYPTVDPAEELVFILPRAAYESIYGRA